MSASRRLLALFALLSLGLFGCASKPSRLAPEWQDYALPMPETKATLNVDSVRTAAMIRNAAGQVGLNIILGNDDLGVYTFTKPDARFRNTTWVLSVDISATEQDRTVVWYRGFVYTISTDNGGPQDSGKPNWGPKSFPSDGSMEKQFRAALQGIS